MKANQKLQILTAIIQGSVASNPGPREESSNKAVIEDALNIYKITLNAIEADPYITASLDDSYDPD